MDFNKIVEQVIFEAAREDVKQRLIKKYMDAKPGTRLPERHFSDVIDHVHDNLLPDANKSQADLEWMSDRHFAGDRHIFFNDNGEIKHKLTEFNKPSIKEKMPKKKLNQYKSWDEFDTAITPHIGAAPTVKEKADRDTKVLFKNDTHIVRQHFGQESIMNAAKLHPENPTHALCDGKATWCIAADSSSGKEYYDSYTSGGKHPVYTIEHTGLHPTDPHRKYAIVADPERTRNGHKSVEFRDEPQASTSFHDNYVLSSANKSIENTEPMQYVHKALGYKGNGKFEIHHPYGEREEYTKNEEGKYHGERKTFSENGVLRTHEHYHNGKKEGMSVEFSESGITTTRNYKDNERHGEEKVTDANGAILSLNHYKNGRRHGLSLRYDETGSDKEIHGPLISSINYHEGEKHGESIENRGFGDKIVSQYHHGILRDQKGYDSSGNLRNHKVKDDPDTDHGNFSVKRYNNSGTLEFSGKEDHVGNGVGISSLYDKDSNLIKTVNYEPSEKHIRKEITNYIPGTTKVSEVSKASRIGGYNTTRYHPETQKPTEKHFFDSDGEKLSSTYFDSDGDMSHAENFYGNGKVSTTMKFHKGTNVHKELTSFDFERKPMTTKTFDTEGKLKDTVHHISESNPISFRNLIEK